MEPMSVELRGGKTATVRCLHEDRWPPVHVRLDQSIEAQRASGLIDDHKYEQIKTWDRVCGLSEMDSGKCLGCPHVRVDEPEVGLRELTAAERPKKVGHRGELPQPSKPAPPFAQARKGRRG